MTRRSKKILLVGIAGFLVLAQIVPYPPATNPPVTGEIVAPPELQSILRRSCYDCHSNETVWPWYSSVIPGKWLVRHDVDEGRGALNFSEWNAYTESQKTHKLEELVEKVRDGEMPLWTYLWLHKKAALSQDDANRLIAWARGESEPQ